MSGVKEFPGSGTLVDGALARLDQVIAGDLPPRGLILVECYDGGRGVELRFYGSVPLFELAYVGAAISSLAVGDHAQEGLDG